MMKQRIVAYVSIQSGWCLSFGFILSYCIDATRARTRTHVCAGCTPFLFWMWLKEEEEEEQWQQFSGGSVWLLLSASSSWAIRNERRHRGSSKSGWSFGCQSYLWWMGIVGAAPSNKRKSSQSTTLLCSTGITSLYYTLLLFFWCSIYSIPYWESFLCSRLLPGYIITSRYYYF